MAGVLACALVLVGAFGFASVAGVNPAALLAASAQSGGADLGALSEQAAGGSGAGDASVSAGAGRAPAAQGVLPERISLSESADIAPVQADHKADAVLLRIDGATSASAINDLLGRADFVVTKDVSDQDLSLGFVEVELEPGTDVARAVRTFEETGAVAGAQPDYAYHLLDADLAAADVQSMAVDDPQASSQWALEYVHAYEAWDLVKAEKSVTVAIFDDGCVVDHEDLAANIVATYNAVGENADVSHVRKNYYHGTHVAGIVSGIANNGKGGAGVSYNAGILPVQVFQANADGSKENAYSSTIIRAYKYVFGVAAEYNIRVVNLSVGGELSNYEAQDQALAALIDEAYKKGIVSVCAAGNKNSTADIYTCFPADYCENAVSVINLQKDPDATDGSGVSVISSSNYNLPGKKTKNISAPGTLIFSSWGPNATSYTTLTGTSMATPLVSGILALEFAADPELTAADAVAALYKGATDLGDEGWDELTGWGMVDAYGAVQALDANVVGPEICAVGESIQLTPTKFDLSAWRWSSSNPAVASVDSTGKVTGKAAGDVVITGTCGDISVEKMVLVHATSLSGGASMLAVGGQTIFALSSNLPNGLWTLSSSDDSVAVALRNGSGVGVWGLAPGRATITATNTSYGVSAQVDVQVFDVSIVNAADAEAGLEVLVGDEIAVELVGQPEGSDVAWTWASGNTRSCSVRADAADSSRATVTGVATGATTITATMQGTGGLSVSADVNVAIREMNDENTQIILSRDAVTYSPDDRGIAPNWKVEYEGKPLDVRYYTYDYADNKAAGTATLTVSGRAGYGYTGSVSKEFTIEPAAIDGTGVVVAAIASQGFTGAAVEPQPVLTTKASATLALPIAMTYKYDLPLVKDTDYVVEYRNNVNAGEATVVIAGRGNYSGTVEKTFTIAPAELSAATFASIPAQTYAGKALQPAIAATYNGTALKAGTDFEATYSKNTNAGTAKVALRGIGNFTGTKNLDFTISPASLAGATIAPIADKAYTGHAIKPGPTVSFDGKTLSYNADYRLSYSSNTKAGTATVTATGIGNYTGSKSRSFKIVAPSVKYRVRQGSTWLAYAKDGASAAAKGSSKKLRSFAAKLASKPYSGSIKYRVRAQGKWGAWKKNGAAVDTGSKSLTGLQVKLSGVLAKHYDVSYRAKARGKWSAWKKNGATAGASTSAQVQAVQVRVVPKG